MVDTINSMIAYIILDCVKGVKKVPFTHLNFEEIQINGFRACLYIQSNKKVRQKISLFYQTPGFEG